MFDSCHYWHQLFKVTWQKQVSDCKWLIFLHCLWLYNTVLVHYTTVYDHTSYSVWTYFSCWSQEMMRFILSFMDFSMSSSIDWSRETNQFIAREHVYKLPFAFLNQDILVAKQGKCDRKGKKENHLSVPNPYSIGWNMPECRSTKMCKHSERPQGSSMGMMSVGKAVSMNAEINTPV